MEKKILSSLVMFGFVVYVVSSVYAMEGMCGMGGSGASHKHGSEESSAAKPATAKPVEVGNKTCPISGEGIKEEMKATYEHEGKVYNFCCAGCVEEFKKDPQKYISKIKEIKLEAYQFGFSPERIVVKKGDIVKIFTTSRDVPHGIYIKEYDINMPVKKDEIKKIEFLADKVGEFDILCSVYCGRGHSNMKAKLAVEE